MEPIVVHGTIQSMDSDSIAFKHGHHDVFVPTSGRPGRVLIELTEHGHGGCGHSPVNTVGYRVRHDEDAPGVEFKVHVQTESCRLDYVILPR